MPNWKKVIVSGSDASLGSLLVSSSLTIGTSSLGSSENTLVIGLPPAGGTGEGGQILLQASGGIYTSASMLDNYQNKLRFLRGTNAGSDAYKLQLDMHTGQIQLPNYNSVTALTGSIVGFLAFDNAGNILTSTGSGGGGGGTFPYTGVAAINGGLIVTGSITASGAIHAQANGAMYFRGGDDAEFWDINTVNTVGIYGQQDQGVASIKLGSGGGTISGRSGSVGIGTTTPTSASLTVNGNVWATSLTGSLQGTSSWANNAITSSYILQAVSASFATLAQTANTASFVLTAQTASYVLNAVSASNANLLDGLDSTIFATTGSNTFRSNQTITGSTTITGSLILTGAFDIGPAEFNATSSATTAGTTIVSTYATGSYNSAFYNYYISSGSNARAGQIMSVWSGSSIQYTEVTTNDIGNTNTASFAVTLATGNVRLSFTAPGVWTVRSIVNLL